MREFKGKVAVVTGGAGGIGRALAERFLAEGMRVAIADVLPDRLQATTDELQGAGHNLIGVVTDVTSPASVEALKDAVLAAFGGVHIVCNNAGIGSGSEGFIWEHDINDWRWSFDVNVMGVINGMNAFVPTMIAQDEEGHIVNTTSGNGGFTPLIYSGIYATTKASVTTITECLWGQLRDSGSKVSASLLYPSTATPGLLNTNLWLAGANRPDRYMRASGPTVARDSLAPVIEMAKAAGIDIPFAPLEEVADLCLEGIRNDTFWITAPNADQQRKIRARADSQIAITESPDYLLEQSPLTVKPKR